MPLRVSYASAKGLALKRWYNEADMNETKKRKRFFARHKILAVFLSLFLIVALTASITLPILYNVVFTVPLEEKEDRISEGVVPNEEDLKNSPHYSHIMIFGVDGAGGDFALYDTPNFDRIFSQGSINLQGKAEYPTISAQNWESMFTGVSPQKHQFTNEKACVFPKMFDSYPTFFKIHASRSPSSSYYVATSWIPITYGLIEPFIPGLTKDACYFGTPGEKTYPAIDETVKNHVIQRLKTEKDTIVFAHFDNIDETAHIFGKPSLELTKAYTIIDNHLGEIYDAYDSLNLIQDTLFILVSDHGHKIGGGHGGESEEEKQATLAAYGGKGDILVGSSGKYVTRDLASIVLYALGDPQPAHMQGGVPHNLFATLP